MREYPARLPWRVGSGFLQPGRRGPPGRLQEYRPTGRQGYPLKALWRAYVGSFVLNLAHTNALIRRLEDDREHQAAVEKAEVEAAARIESQKDADEKAEQQAQRDAESQARIAAQELAAAQESKRRIAATELLKTQTLETQIEHEEVVADIFREIVRIRLAGHEDRARITNEYMTRAEATAASFEEETVETEGRIQAYLDFNAELLDRLGEYQADIGARLERVRASVAEQQASIDALKEEAQGLVAREEEEGATPEPEPLTP